MPRPSATIALLGALLIATGAPALAQSAAPSASYAVVDLSAARSVCEEKTGRVQIRQAMFGTNDDASAWIDLGRSIELCKFTAEDGSSIFVDTLTLASPVPTLASVAYLSKVPAPEYDPNKGNPATVYCASLAASSAFGIGASGGGWVDTTDADFPVVAMCVFPDGSMIDDWGLEYHSADIIRGIDLTHEFVYQPADSLPPIF